MINSELLVYIKQCLAQNFSKDQIIVELEKSGWPKNDIQAAFSSIPTTSSTIKPEILVKKPEEQKNDRVLQQAIDNRTIIDEKLKNKSEKNLSKKRTWGLPTVKFNKIAIIITTTLAFLFLGAGALAYYYYYFPTPERVIGKMLDRLGSINSLAYASELKIEYQFDKSLKDNSFYKNFSSMVAPSALELLAAPNFFDKPHQVILNLSGQTDFQSNAKNVINFKIQTDELFSNTVLGAEVRSFDRLFYANLDLPNLGFVDLSVLKNQWIKYDAVDSIDKLNNNNLENADNSLKASTTAVISFFDKAILARDILVRSSVFQITSTLPSEIINNNDTWHYGFVINRESLIKFIGEIDNIFTAEGKRLTEQEIVKIRESLNKLELIKGEIWIGKKDFLPYKLFIDLAVKDESLSVSDTGVDPIKIKNIFLTLSGQNFNQPIIILEPEVTKSFQEAIMIVLSQVIVVEENPMTEEIYRTDTGPAGDQNQPEILATSTEILGDQTLPMGIGDNIIINLDSDNDGLSDYDETEIYNTNPLLPDTDSDGYLDGAEVKNGYNPNGDGLLTF